MPKQRAARETSAADNPAQSHAPADGLNGVAEQPEAAPAAESGERSGADARQRGWFWHWNSMVTQYAPLIGLKGIGLLNSYTVWTDRREHSPYHGYAFPSQTAEAAFYGEDRAELITINKILVALDLIEIRKEMVQRTDEQGRRWRVPHNFYRVKDRSDGLDLRTADVLRVVELAAVDKGVFRFIRRIFSAKFAPIDRANVWHTILVELDDQPTWRALREQAATLEARNSARSKAGHRKRASSGARDEKQVTVADMTIGHLDECALMQDEQSVPAATPNTTTVAVTNGASSTSVDDSNSGLALAVAGSNDGLKAERATSVVESNQAPRNSVAPSNSTYHQAATTTTTTSATAQPDQYGTAAQPSRAHDASILEDASVAGPATSAGAATPGGPAAERNTDRPDGPGPLGDPGALVVSLFEAANDRRASKLERVLLSELERAADPAARRAGASGSDWVAAALREAVASGSAFVAPKRIREIISRWAAEGAGPPGRLTLVEDAQPPAAPKTTATHRVSAAWDATLGQMRGNVDESSYDRLFASSVIESVRGDEVVVRVASAAAAEKLGREYRGLVERSLGQALGRAATVRFVAAPAGALEPAESAEPESTQIVVAAEDAERGRQLWTAVLGTLRTHAAPTDLDRLAAVVPLGQGAQGELLLGLPNRQAGRLIESRYRAPITDALADVLGCRYDVRLVERSAWTTSA